MPPWQQHSKIAVIAVRQLLLLLHVRATGEKIRMQKEEKNGILPNRMGFHIFIHF